MRRSRRWVRESGPVNCQSAQTNCTTGCKNPRNFRTVLAVGERMFSLYKHEQAGEPVTEVPELCEKYDIGKTNLYEVLRSGKYKKEMSTPKPESAKPARQVTTVKLREMEEAPQGKGCGKKSS